MNQRTTRGLGRTLALALALACDASHAPTESNAPGPAPTRVGQHALGSSSPRPSAQTLAFTKYRFGMLRSERVEVYRTGDFQPVARFEAPGASHLVALLGGGLLGVGPDELYRLSPRDSRPKRFPPLAEAVSGARVMPHPRHAEEFALGADDARGLVGFDLGDEAGELLSPSSRLSLDGFDGRAVVRLRDGGVAFTVTDGLAVRPARGEPRVLRVPELSQRVWALVRSARLDRLWAIDGERAHLVAWLGEPRVISSLALPEGAVAAASSGSRLGVLSVEREAGDELRLRVDVWDRNPERHRVLRFSDSPDGEAESPSPEIALSPRGGLVAVRAYGVQVFDWSRGARVLSSTRGKRALPLAQASRDRP